VNLDGQKFYTSSSTSVVISVLFLKLVQRIFNFGDNQNISHLTRDKELSIFIYETSFNVIIYRSYQVHIFLKIICYFGPT